MNPSKVTAAPPLYPKFAFVVSQHSPTVMSIKVVLHLKIFKN